MQRGGIEVGSVWPHQRITLGVNPHLVEDRQILQGPKQFSLQHRQEVDLPAQAIFEEDFEGVRTDY